jgi:membrane protein
MGSARVGRNTSTPDLDGETAEVVDVTAALVPGERAPEAEAHGRSARFPWQIPPRGLRDVALRVGHEWGDDHVALAAAAVAFYSFLAMIPALVATVSLLGLVAQGREPQAVIDDVFGALPGEAQTLLSEQLEAITAQSSGSLSFGFVIGIALSVWTASSAIGQLVTAINIAYDEDETRNWARRKLSAIGLTLGAIVYVAFAVFCVVAVPDVIARTGLGVGARRLLNLAVWPGLAGSFLVALALLYRFAPDRRPARWRWVSVGSVCAVVAWIVATLGFRVYVSQFGSYNETYGSLAGVVVVLLWLWLTAIVILVGAEINAELEHQTAEDSTIGDPRPMGRRGAVKADTLGDVQT